MDQQFITPLISKAIDRFLRHATKSVGSGMPGRFSRYDIKDISSARNKANWVPYLLRVRPVGPEPGGIWGKGHFLDLTDLRIDYVEGQAQFEVELGADPDRLTIRYLTRGTLTYFLGSSVIAEMQAGDSIFRLNKSPLLRYRTSADYASLVIAASVRRPPLQAAAVPGRRPGGAIAAGLVPLGQSDFWSANLAYVLDFAVNILASTDANASVALLNEYLYLLCANELAAHSPSGETSNLYRKVPPKLATAETYVMENAVRSLTVEEVAASAGLTVRNLHKLFLKHRGLSPRQFIQDRRLEGVRRALDEAGLDATVSEIANAWSFSNLGTFAGVYKRRFGELPSYTLKNGLGRGVRKHVSTDFGAQRSGVALQNPSEASAESQAVRKSMKSPPPIHAAIEDFVSTVKLRASEPGSPYRHFANASIEAAQAASDHSPHQIAVRRSTKAPAFRSETFILNAGDLRLEYVSARSALDFDVSCAPARLSIRYIARGHNSLLVGDRVVLTSQAGDYAFRFSKSLRFRVTTSDEYDALFVSFPIPMSRYFSISYQEEIGRRTRQCLEHGFMIVSQSDRWATHLAYAIEHAIQHSRSQSDSRTQIFVEFLYLLCAQELVNQTQASIGDARPTIVPFKLKVAESFIAANAKRSPLVEEVAAASELSGRHLHLLFVSFHGASPLEFILEQRLLGIRRALQTAEDHETVRSIAEAWSYRNFGHFSAAYKKRFGELPSETLAVRRSTKKTKSAKSF